MNAKKTIRVLAALMFAVCTIFALSSCAALDAILAKLPLPQKGCAHEMTETAEKAATCLEAGNTRYFTCSKCNKLFSDQDGTTETTLEATIVAAKGHKEANISAVAATCTKTGLTAGKKCSACNEILVAQQTTPIVAHELQDMAGKAPTCAEEGYTDYKACTNCDYIEGKEVVGVIDHTYVIDAAIAPTCIAPGLTEGKYCSECFEVFAEQEIVDPLGHTPAVDAAVAPTCTDTGLTEGSHCSVCNEVFVAQTVVDALGHDMNDGEYLVTPTCTDGGSVKYTCKRNCGHFTTEDVPPKHDIVVTPGTPATCYADGMTDYEECTQCDYVKESVVIPGGHNGNWAPIDASTEQFVCDVCNRIIKRERNNMISDVAFPPADGGKNTKIDFTDVIHSANADGGKYLVFDVDILLGKSVQANTTENVVSLKINDGGGNNVAGFQINMKNNELLISGTVVNALPVLKPMGETYITFRIVGVLASEKNASGNYVSTYYLYAKETGTEGPMTLVRTTTKTSTYTGTVTRADNYNAALYAESKAIIALDVNNASFIRTNDANYLYSDCDHVLGDWTVEKEAVACKTDGVAKRSCTVDGCGYTETEYISAHKFSAVEGKAPTCTENGYYLYWACSDCKKVVGKVESPAFGHDMSDWFDVEDGAKQKKACENGCGYYELRTVAENNPITFDDGTVTSGDKIKYAADVVISDDKTTADDGLNFAKWSVKDGALCVTADASTSASGKGRQFLCTSTTDGSTEGNVYTFDFDIYIDPAANATNNSSRVVTEVSFGNKSYSMGTYGSKVTRYAQQSKFTFGTTKTWISFRYEYTVVENGKANLVVYVKDSVGNYKAIDKLTVEGSAIKLDGFINVGFTTYATGGTFTYYIDNVSLTRHVTGYDAQ